MMDAVTVPPFERFYAAWSGEIFAFLRRRLGAADVHRRRRPAGEPVEGAAVDARPAYAEIEHLANGLPPTERAAVVLRYGYDLSYEDIGAALGSTADAARQATCSGIRRLRRKELQ